VAKGHQDGVRQKGRRRRVGTTVDVPAAERLRFRLPTPKSRLARDALVIERHYGKAMDIEWGRDGVDGKPTSCRRPETVKSQ
jgi:pyruvate,water dikinase